MAKSLRFSTESVVRKSIDTSQQNEMAKKKNVWQAH